MPENFELTTGIDDDPRRKITAGMSQSLLDSLYPTQDSLNVGKFANASAGQTRAHTRGVGGDELASQQLDRILAHDSPLRRRALQIGIDNAASRGLVNSSIAGGNAVGSLIDRATPLATFDASAYGTAARDNQAAKNQVGMFNAGQRTQASMSNANSANRFRELLASGQINSMADIRNALFNIDNREDQQAFQTGEREGSQDFQLMFQQNDQDFRGSMAALDRDLQREGYDLQERTAILQAMTQARSNQAQLESNAALAIYQNPNLDAGQQNRAFQDFRNSVSNNIFNDVVADFPDLPDLFPNYFGGGG